MADYINNVAAADKYTNDLTIGPNFDAHTAVITVANNPALMQFAVGKLGDWRWTDEREYFSIPQSFKVGNVIGVRLRNANPGQVARILATLSGPDDVQFESGLPFTATLSAQGAVSSGNMITGLVSGAGVVISGTGYTVVRLGVGSYHITFDTPFVAVPTILVTGQYLAVQPGATYSNPGPGDFQAVIFNPSTFAGMDTNFSFVAFAPQ